MGAKLAQLYERTLKVSSDLEAVDQGQIEQLIQLRDEAVTELNEQNELLETDLLMIRAVSGYDEVFVSRMETIRDEAFQSLERVRAFKRQKVLYEQNYSADSYFIDKKK